MGVEIEVGDSTNYKTDKKPVRMEYLDDIDIEEFRELPSFKRMCICILKNDHSCKYMGFAPTKAEKSVATESWKSIKIFMAKTDNEIRYRSPVYKVMAVPVDKVVANAYNPNVVAPPEMKLLELSIWEDGYTMPCVCYYVADKDVYELVDGYHRYMVMKTSRRIYEREHGLLPVVVIEKDISNRMASTIRHNRARGTHNVELMS